jgi:hypothetical protein
MAAKKTSSKTKSLPAKSKAANAKTAVKTASTKARSTLAPAKKLKPASFAAWPQAMSAGGAVAANAAKSVKTGPANGALRPAGATEPKSALHRNGSTAQAHAASPWLAPWGQMSAAATQLMDPDALKSAVNRQFQIYQTMARFSPLSLALQMMQGLLPTDARSAQTGTVRRS